MLVRLSLISFLLFSGFSTAELRDAATTVNAKNKISDMRFLVLDYKSKTNKLPINQAEFEHLVKSDLSPEALEDGWGHKFVYSKLSDSEFEILSPGVHELQIHKKPNPITKSFLVFILILLSLILNLLFGIRLIKVKSSKHNN